MVLQHFRGELTMLDSGRGGGEAGVGGGGDFAPGEDEAPAGGRSARGGERRRPAGDLDDDIPF